MQQNPFILYYWASNIWKETGQVSGLHCDARVWSDFIHDCILQCLAVWDFFTLYKKIFFGTLELNAEITRLKKY